MTSISNNKRIAKNTMFMYFRMLLILCITLYTSRVVLKTLGVEDFGIYNLVNGIIVSFSFLNHSLVSAAQRFMSYSIGKGDYAEFRTTYTTCILLFALIGIVFCLIVDPIGLWLIHNKLNIPLDRMHAAVVVFHIAVGHTFLSFIRVPFNSAIISHERMSFYAYLSIVEAIAKLLIVYLLTVINFDKLIAYSLLLLSITLIINIVFCFYCNRLDGCQIERSFDKQKAKSIFSFSGWSLYEGMANIAKTEIVGFLLNIFHGVSLNAAVGIAKQVNSAINNFTVNFQVAYRPQITKSYASGDISRLFYLIFNTSKFSGVIFLIIAIPLCYNIDFILNLWLGIVPDFAAPFAVCFIFVSLVEAVGGPFWMTGHAIGNIKWLQIISGSIRLLSIPAAYFLLHIGCNPSFVFIAQVILEFFVMAYRLFYVKKKLSFPVIAYFKQVILKLLICSACSIIMIHVVCHKMTDWNTLIVSTILSTTLFAAFTWFYLLSSSQRVKIRSSIKHKISK